MQAALCYLKPDVTVTGGVARALEALHRRGYRIHSYQVIHMNDRLYCLTYEKGFDAVRDSWQINRRFASIGPWIAFLLTHKEVSKNLQERLKSEQGPALPSADSRLRAEIGHKNRLQNCIHVPDTPYEVNEQVALLFPDESPLGNQIEIDAQDVIAEFQRHQYQPRKRTFPQFRQILGRRVTHRAARVAPKLLPDSCAWSSATIDDFTVSRALEALTLSASELDLMKALLSRGTGHVSNRLLKAMNVDEVLSRNFVHLTEWDRAMLFGYFAYPTVEPPIDGER